MYIWSITLPTTQGVTTYSFQFCCITDEALCRALWWVNEKVALRGCLPHPTAQVWTRRSKCYGVQCCRCCCCFCTHDAPSLERSMTLDDLWNLILRNATLSRPHWINEAQYCPTELFTYVTLLLKPVPATNGGDRVAAAAWPCVVVDRFHISAESNICECETATSLST